MLGDIDCCAAILTAKREPLNESKRHEECRRPLADDFEGRDEPDQFGEEPHQHDGDQEGSFATDTVTEATKEKRAQGSDGEACAEGGETCE